MGQIILIGVCVVVIGLITWKTGQLINAMRSRERTAERLGINDEC